MRITIRRLAVVMVVAMLAISGAALADELIQGAQELPWLPSPEAAVSCDATQTEGLLADVEAGAEILDLAALAESESCDYCTSRQDCYSVCGTTEVACVYDPYCGDGRFCACLF